MHSSIVARMPISPAPKPTITVSAMLSLPAAMSALAENARTERVLILLSVLMFFVYFIFFLLRWQVW